MNFGDLLLEQRASSLMLIEPSTLVKKLRQLLQSNQGAFNDPTPLTFRVVPLDYRHHWLGIWLVRQERNQENPTRAGREAESKTPANAGLVIVAGGPRPTSERATSPRFQ